jgi:CO dehydrogenase/acetyl-CoA synthase gamma subunit (corrinoid Fe-S protein)
VEALFIGEIVVPTQTVLVFIVKVIARKKKIQNLPKLEMKVRDKRLEVLEKPTIKPKIIEILFLVQNASENVSGCLRT